MPLAVAAIVCAGFAFTGFVLWLNRTHPAQPPPTEALKAQVAALDDRVAKAEMTIMHMRRLG